MKRKQKEPHSTNFDIQALFKAPDELTSSDLGAVANPYHLRSWWNSIQAIPPDSGYEDRAKLYQRALTYMPGSYKLWYHFLRETRKHVKSSNNEELTEIVAKLFERALVYMNKMPKIWLYYAKFMGKSAITKTREIYDRALIALPVTQHGLIWGQAIEWACSLEGQVETACHFYRRYLILKPQAREEYITFLLTNDRLEEALELYIEILDDENPQSLKKTRYQLTLELCEFISRNPSRSMHLQQQPDQLIRNALAKYTDEAGRLWICLADYHVRQGLFAGARGVFEEALARVSSTRDFGIVFNAYMKFEEQMMEAAVEQQDQSEDEDEDDGVEAQIDRLIQFTFRDIPEKLEEANKCLSQPKKQESEDDDEMKFLYLENLIARRPFLLSNVVLRQNPNNVGEWLNRVKLCESIITADNPYLAIKTFTEAIAAVDPLQAVGKVSKLWIAFGQFYERHDEDLDNANAIFHKASQLQYKHLDELAAVYCAWAEMHVRHRNYESAIQVLEHACQGSRPSKKEGIQSLHANLKVWSFLVDILQSLGRTEATKQAYQRMLQLKIATPQTVLNYTSFLSESQAYEEAFRVYERALAVFDTWPHAHELWLSYLKSMIERHADTKVERIRDLFQQVLAKVPPKQAKVFFYMYADFEENFGLLNHAMAVYDRASKDLQDPSDKYEVLNLQIAKSADFFGLSKTRQLFERCFTLLQNGDLIQMGLRFAKLERKMGESDRARAIYQHLSQFCNPRVSEEQFWGIWEKFEVYHGNEDTYSDFMRAKRTVELRFSVAMPIMTGNAGETKASIDLMDGAAEGNAIEQVGEK
ncbi:hypothetical protein FGO68_gene1183 [Halteria grandinella]|uniref:Pre-mRNA-splicing factor SYF1 n=1 Tax=Halteria grandinella TaxID=5974 RepID=A0A8J8T5R5_HALGN|nr:hypothetical protein FGO68_gene1183 [Halteria grandinella]